MNILSQGRSRQYKVTRPASISATTRLPSHLVSNTQSGSSNGASVKVASIGCNRFGSFDSLAIQLCPGSARPARACFRIAGASEHAASRSSGQENGLSTVSNNLSSPSKRRPPRPLRWPVDSRWLGSYNVCNVRQGAGRGRTGGETAKPKPLRAAWRCSPRRSVRLATSSLRPETPAVPPPGRIFISLGADLISRSLAAKTPG